VVLTSDTIVTAMFDTIIITVNDTAICYNATATLTPGSNVPSPTYQWYPSQTEITPFHTGASYTISNLTADTVFDK
jgi:hypothetical protein